MCFSGRLSTGDIVSKLECCSGMDCQRCVSELVKWRIPEIPELHENDIDNEIYWRNDSKPEAYFKSYQELFCADG